MSRHGACAWPFGCAWQLCARGPPESPLILHFQVTKSAKAAAARFNR